MVGSVHIKGGGEGSTEKSDYSCHAQSELSDKWIVWLRGFMQFVYLSWQNSPHPKVNFLLLLMCVDVCLNAFMGTMPMKVLAEARSIGSPGSAVTGGCEHLLEVLGLNLGPLEEHQGLLIAEPGLHTPVLSEFFQFSSLHLLI